jgi:DNA repair protein RadA/Sms
MLLAVLHRHAGISMAEQDVFINVVGGIRLAETGCDLPVILAVASSFQNRVVAREQVCFGEVGLGGEIRPVFNGEERLKEAATHGFKRALVPKANMPRRPIEGLEIVPVTTLNEALDKALN